MLSDFVKYVKQYWHDRPDKSTPLNADRLNHIENGIGSNSEAINQIANAVVSNIVNDPDKIASIAAVYALQEKLGTGELPSDASDAISAINTLYSNLNFYYRGENPNKDVKTLASGIYQIDGGNEAYTPTRWGMLIVFSAPNYGYALFTHTDGSVYVRTWSQRNGSYYIDWKKLSN